MNIELSSLERGDRCSSKQTTTPDPYPLSSTSGERVATEEQSDPVMEVTGTFRAPWISLPGKHFVIGKVGLRESGSDSSTGSATRDEHSSSLRRSSHRVRVLLRGPQTPGELRIARAAWPVLRSG